MTTVFNIVRQARARRAIIGRDRFPRLRLRGEISGGWRRFFRGTAMDARVASAEAGRDLARAAARDKRSRGGHRGDRQFQRQLRARGLAGRYCLLYQEAASAGHDLDASRCVGLTKRELRARLAGPNVLLNLAYSLHPPFLLEFERRIFSARTPVPGKRLANYLDTNRCERANSAIT